MLDYEARLRFIKEIIEPVWNSEEAKEGVNAFLNKRRPPWQG
ncbi:MAG: hypothetical protein ABII26_05235 [Pseudomonadota bacterium]